MGDHLNHFIEIAVRLRTLRTNGSGKPAAERRPGLQSFLDGLGIFSTWDSSEDRLGSFRRHFHDVHLSQTNLALHVCCVLVLHPRYRRYRHQPSPHWFENVRTKEFDNADYRLRRQVLRCDGEHLRRDLHRHEPGVQVRRERLVDML